MASSLFDESPDCNAQVTNLIKRATRRKYLLRRFSKFLPGSDLKLIYTSLVRSLLEYSAVSYTTQISKFQSNRLENVQKQCLKIMYGYHKSYDELLEISGLEMLENRRKKLFEKFAEKMSENKNYSDFFPLNNCQRVNRCTKIYKENHAKTDRLYRSPVSYTHLTLPTIYSV